MTFNVSHKIAKHVIPFVFSMTTDKKNKKLDNKKRHELFDEKSIFIVCDA